LSGNTDATQVYLVNKLNTWQSKEWAPWRSLPTLFSYNNFILFLIPTAKSEERTGRGWGMYVSRESRSRRLSQHTAMSNVMLSRYQSILIGRFIDLITYSCETSNPWFVKTHTAAPNPHPARQRRDKDTDTERDRATARVSAQDQSLISGPQQQRSRSLRFWISWRGTMGFGWGGFEWEGRGPEILWLQDPFYSAV